MLGEITSDALRERVLVLRTLPQFAALDEDALILLADHAHLLHPVAGTTLFREGEPLEHVSLLARGAARVRFGQRSRVVEAPNELGLLSLFAGRDTAHEAVVERDATILELPASVVLTSFYDSVSIARNTIRMAARRLLDRRGNLPMRPEEATDVSPGIPQGRTPTLVERMLIMRRSPVWQHANLDALAEMCGHVEEGHPPAGTLLWDVGDAAFDSFRLEYGIVQCTNAKGETVRVGGGHFIGGLDAFAGAPRSYRAVTETDCVLLRLRASTQLSILEAHPQLAARLRMELSRIILEEQESSNDEP